MNNDGWGQVGAGPSDKRIAGDDLQHYRQTRTADEGHVPPRRVRQGYQDGGPMKHQGLDDRMDESLGMRNGPEGRYEQSMGDRRRESVGMSEYLQVEKNRHEEALEHHMNHLEKHHSRHYNSQYGHDTHKYK